MREWFIAVSAVLFAALWVLVLVVRSQEDETRF